MKFGMNELALMLSLWEFHQLLKTVCSIIGRFGSSSIILLNNGPN